MTVLPTGPPPAVALPAQPAGVAWPTAAWPTAAASPAVSVALDGLLDESFGAGDSNQGRADAEARFGQSLAFVAAQDGRLVAERYGPTAGPEVPLISWSMAKSVTHALAGVLVGQGRLDVAAPAPVPEWSSTGDPRSRITLDHLLRMVPGTEFNEDYVDAEVSHCIEMLFGDGAVDMAAYTAALPAVAEPDSVFNYSSGTTNLICRILADQVGRGPDFERWAREVLFDPLGVDPELTFDGAGTWVGSSFLHATAREFAKFGLLHLRDGVWDGERILPAGWVDYARTLRAIDDEGGRYGAHWWVWGPDDRVFHAAGYETQRIIVDPTADLVLVRLGKTPTELASNVDGWLERIRRTLGGSPDR